MADLGALDFQFPDKKRTALELSYEFMEKIAHHTSLVNSFTFLLLPPQGDEIVLLPSHF